MKGSKEKEDDDLNDNDHASTAHFVLSRLAMMAGKRSYRTPQ